jgi:VWFA-related protein
MQVRMLVLLGALVVAAIVSTRPLTGQQQPTFTSGAELVVVHVTVTDARGSYIKGLPRETFAISDENAPQRIQLFSGEDAPVTVGLLVDGSGSMREGRDRVIAAAGAFAETSRPSDEIFALGFNEHVRAALPPSMPFTNDAQTLRAGLSRVIRAQGRTALFDAVAEGLAYVRTGNHLRRVLVVVADGGDNASTTTYQQVMREALASNAAIYTVGVMDSLTGETNSGTLKRLSQSTGGQSFFPRAATDMDRVLRQIAEDIRHSYTLGYVPSNPTRDGGFRRIRVTVNDPKHRSAVVRSRTGYLAGTPEGRR